MGKIINLSSVLEKRKNTAGSRLHGGTERPVFRFDPEYEDDGADVRKVLIH